MTENDKNNLFGGKRCIAAFFAKRKALKKLDNLINDANQILETYKEVTFDNALETAFYQANSLYLKETYWDNAIEMALRDIYEGHQSDISMQIHNVVVTNNLHPYAQTRSILETKRDILEKFRDDLKNLN